MVDDILRRQSTSSRYAAFIRRLERDFPGELFLLVRYGDHQPDFAATLVEPAIDDATRARRLMRMIRGTTPPITPST